MNCGCCGVYFNTFALVDLIDGELGFLPLLLGFAILYSGKISANPLPAVARSSMSYMDTSKPGNMYNFSRGAFTITKKPNASLSKFERK